MAAQNIWRHLFARFRHLPDPELPVVATSLITTLLPLFCSERPAFLFEHGGSALKRYLKVRQRPDADEVFRPFVAEIAADLVRQCTTSIESRLYAGFLNRR